MFCKSFTKYNRRKTGVVNIGNVPLGGENPVRIQSMINAATTDIDAAAVQCEKIAKAGADYVRATVQGLPEANAMKTIKSKLAAKNINIPLIADVHFNRNAAKVAAQYVEKVRINPGNFIDKTSIDRKILNTDEYNAELQHLRNELISLICICKQHKTALRIGVNHGSLSERIMNRYGDTPTGMVESAMEFLRICKDENFENAVVSMKSSNTRVMVYAYRLLVEKMNAEEMNFPLHIGLTEAGDGADARIKSAAGIGTLLADGLGDTIRVSLTENPENEIPVAKILVNYFKGRENHKVIPDVDTKKYFPYTYSQRKTKASDVFGGKNQIATVADLSHINPVYDKDFEELGFVKNGKKWTKTSNSPDAVYTGSSLFDSEIQGITILSDEMENLVRCDISCFNNDFLNWIKRNPQNILMLESANTNAVAELRACFLMLENANVTNPVIIHRNYDDKDIESLQIKAACDFGALLIDGFGDAICLQNTKTESKNSVKICFAILQATRVRFSKTEFIACPSCGRTLFDIQKTLTEIKNQTSHLQHLKIAVMGCIVNGTGEMADADYGYVGASAGKISLYKNKILVKRNIPQQHAVAELVALIKENGDWTEKLSNIAGK
ncbi:MAG: (E)-4-hydroxy-3-methylbut-2-enyl-diphosphate synthase [Prevotellaceae bacterium]|jgi:(E)-4-hydroxy-3-methylbut-2-enyl-diphosphate synthase|nr:(E)-4-hydroxy-3-methylbut-2-enyl-diphosphate synthase [Prevotellaceae bacterium]